eukprot:365039-Chlamydomonas_euryale.AAC.6
MEDDARVGEKYGVQAGVWRTSRCVGQRGFESVAKSGVVWRAGNGGRGVEGAVSRVWHGECGAHPQPSTQNP